MSAVARATEMWVRVGGGMESVPDHMRHGPADREFPPPGGPWEALVLNGRLVGWGEKSGLRAARQCVQTMRQPITSKEADRAQIDSSTTLPR